MAILKHKVFESPTPVLYFGQGPDNKEYNVLTTLNCMVFTL